ncbi:outer membrane lipoprotein chaperone LolA [Salinivibrio sp. ES.052]|uniref:outer membrane lipoprotein chaperone LolA n=1 Tax=Salinivibrio sp. ES.052 TaxID=1882823 RepID=UPI0009290880|nr:outer membrane lipoprotein chaperone LolA [Salinivibrio sp. ES.052]SIN93235.1 outer membrane lipoprotein carrier protein [Salinivibrio sp. ES.052]
MTRFSAVRHLLAVISLLIAFTAQAQTQAQQHLMERLSQVDAFTAQFSQTVQSPEGEVIHQAKGRLAIERPNLFNWTTTAPDETIMISDGETLWYYSPFVEQVTAMWLEEATAQTPFVLLTRNQPSDWQAYQITQSGDTFTLTPKTTGTIGEFDVTVKPDGTLTGFKVVEQDGQQSQFVLSQFSRQAPKADLFSFTPPESVMVDDQRQPR